MIRHWLGCLIAIMFLATPALAQGEFFLSTDIGSSARMIRIGNIEGFNTLAASVFENPAGLYRINRFSSSLFTTTLMDEVVYKNLSLAFRLPKGMLAIGYMSTDVSDIPKTEEVFFENDSEFIQNGAFSYNNSVIKVAYQLSQTKNFHIGVAGTYYSTKIDDVTGSGFNADAGVIFDSEPLVLSVSVRNAISSSKVKYSNNQEEKLALQTVYGAKYTWNDFDIFGQLKTLGSNRGFAKSAGVNYKPSLLPFLQVSGAYKEFAVLREIRSNFVIGIGLSFFDISFDYAYERSDHVVFNHKHYFSIGFEI